MRILIADDASSLPASVQDMFGRAPAGAAADKKTPSVESVIIAFSGGPAAAAAPAKSTGGGTELMAARRPSRCRPARRAACTISRSCSPRSWMRSAWRC